MIPSPWPAIVRGHVFSRLSRRLSNLPDVALATCSLLPDLDDDERIADPCARGVRPRRRASRLGRPVGSMGRRSAWWCIRSTWDYAERRDAFLAWCAARSASAQLGPGDRLEHGQDLSADARRRRDPNRADDVDRARCARRGTRSFRRVDLVVKPSISSGVAAHVAIRPDAITQAARAHVERLLNDGRDGDGAALRRRRSTPTARPGSSTSTASFSHADPQRVRCSGRPGLPPISSGPSRTSRHGCPDAEERAVAEATLDALPWPRAELLYARVDLVRGGERRAAAAGARARRAVAVPRTWRRSRCAARGGDRRAPRARLTASG